MSSSDPHSNLRQATVSDISRLNAICADCFTHSLLWSGDHTAARAWWHAMIEGDFSEVWVLDGPAPGSEPTILAFTVLLSDEAAWHRARNPVRMTRAQKAVQLMRNPSRIWSRMRYKSPPEQAVELPRRTLELPPASRIFVEHFAVAPEGQGKGLARALVKIGQDRARHHERAGILYMVDRTNVAMQKLMVSEGLVVIRDAPVQYAFAQLTGSN